VAETGDWGRATHFYGSELAMDDFLIDGVGFEESKAILGLTFLVLASEEVNPFKDCIRFSLICLAVGLTSMCYIYSATCALDEWGHSIFDGQFNPFVEVEMENEHLV